MTRRMLITAALLGALYFPTITFAVVINEIRIDQPGADTDEYFELAGSPGTSLDGLSYIVIGDGTGGSGVIEAVIDLSGLAIPTDGFFLAAESTFSITSGVDLFTGLNFENGDNVTHMLVSGLSAGNGTDLDSNDDGVLDTSPWTGIVDAVALLNSIGSGDQVYSSNLVGPVDSSVPLHVLRSPDISGNWQVGPADPAAGQDSPGTANSPAAAVAVTEPGTALLLAAGGLGLLWLRRRQAGVTQANTTLPGLRLAGP